MLQSPLSCLAALVLFETLESLSLRVIRRTAGAELIRLLLKIGISGKNLEETREKKGNDTNNTAQS